MPQAIRITAEDLEDIIDWGRSVNMNLEHLRQQVEPEFPELGPNYLITDGRIVHNNVTCTVMTSADFFRTWKFGEGGELLGHLNEIERV